MDFTELECQTFSSGFTEYTIENADLIPGENYYLSVGSPGGSVWPGTFGLTILSGITPSYWTWTNNVVHPTTLDQKVGIGTNDVPAGYKLGVAGKLIKDEVKVASVVNWPDYVFEKEYPLNSLEEVEEYILKNGHLSGIPPEGEVEQYGFNLGQMDSKLLPKIEELTIYLIAKHKSNLAL